MTTKARVWYPNTSYHITARGNRRNDIFKDDEDFEVYLTIMEGAIEYFQNLYEIICYCLMDNHVHILLKTKEKHMKDFMSVDCQVDLVHPQYSVFMPILVCLYMSFADNNLSPHLPYIVCLIIFILLLVPSTKPLLKLLVTAFSTASKSFSRLDANDDNSFISQLL